MSIFRISQETFAEVKSGKNNVQVIENPKLVKKLTINSEVRFITFSGSYIDAKIIGLKLVKRPNYFVDAIEITFEIIKQKDIKDTQLVDWLRNPKQED